MANNSSCCPSSAIESIIDYGTGAGSPKSFMERIGAMNADRLPGPRIGPNYFRVHEIPLKPPLPLPELQQYLNGQDPPDRGQTYGWPHPTFE